MAVTINEQQRGILDIIAVLANHSVTTSVRDSAVVQLTGLPAEEVYDYLNQLEGLGYITIGVKARGADYRLTNMTWEGLSASFSSK
jgi:DNA-binding IclR family transcriptional regulator